MKVWIHRYNSGALLRFDFGDGRQGYSCLHPWPQFGQGTLEDNINSLLSGEPSPLIYKTLYFANLDADGRQNKINVFSGLGLPESHFLLPWQWLTGSPKSIVLDNLESLKEKSSIPLFKVKLTPKESSDFIKNLVDAESKWGAFKLRLDFNSTFDHQGVKRFLDDWKKKFGNLNGIDFIEDPCSFSEREWTNLKADCGLKIGVDHEIKSISELARSRMSQFSDILIYKPASQFREEILALAEKFAMKICVTHSLEHPLGRIGAYFEGAWLKTHFPNHCVPGGFIELKESPIGREGFETDFESFVAPSCGFGFDEELKKLKWEFLV